MLRGQRPINEVSGPIVLSDVLIFAFRLLCPAYATQDDRRFGLSPLLDQRLAGLDSVHGRRPQKRVASHTWLPGLSSLGRSAATGEGAAGL
jgi:hypothetical protein